MSSEENLVAQVGLELLECNPAVAQLGMSLVLANNSDDQLKLPAIIVSAKFQSEEPAAALAKKFSLGVELRTLRTQPSDDKADEAFRAIGDALNPSQKPPPPPTFTKSFSYFTIENWDGTEDTIGETISRRRDYVVFAQLL